MNESKATRYQRLRRRGQTRAWLLAGVALAVVAFTPLGRWLEIQSVRLASAAPVDAQGILTLAIYITFIVLLCEAAAWPALMHLSSRVDPVYGRAESAAARSRLQGTVLLLPAAIIAAGVVWTTAAATGSVWWLVAGLLLSVGLVAAVHGGPTILTRLAGVRPLDRPQLAAGIAELARRAGVPVAAIQEWVVDEESTTIAMVAGVGAGRRVLVASAVAQSWTDDEVAVVVAHELAHHVHHDLLQALCLNAAVLCAGLWAGDVVVTASESWLGLRGIDDLAALPVVAFVAWAVWLATTPLRHAQSRAQERRADRFAIASTGNADAFVSAVRRASARHMAEERPTALTRWLFHRHPSVTERLALADAWRRERAG